MEIVTPEDLARLVRSTRKARGETQVAVARRAGVSRDTLIRIEQGHARTELAAALAILSALELTLSAAASLPSDEPDAESESILDDLFRHIHEEDRS